MDWVKLWPIVLTLVGLIGAGFTLKADVDRIREAIGAPGSLPVIQLKIEQLGEKVKHIEDALERQDNDRGKLLEKVDSLLYLLREREDRPRKESK